MSTSSSDGRRYPERPFAGVGGLIFDKGRILLVERGHEPLNGWWSLPGGALETGERIEDGLRREIREETGLEVEVLRLFDVFEIIVPDVAGRIEYHYILLDYLCRPVKGTAAAASDAKNLAWVKLSELPRYKIAAGTLAMIERAFASMSEGE